jgi:hypothetical protein
MYVFAKHQFLLINLEQLHLVEVVALTMMFCVKLIRRPFHSIFIFGYQENKNLCGKQQIC